MPTSQQLPVKDLKLDLKNFRTVQQKTEADAVKAMISISPDRFWALMESLIDDGFIPTENIIALRSASDTSLTVKEGNRRIAGLKLIHGILNSAAFGVPSNIQAKISAISTQWKAENSTVPCTMYDAIDATKVDKIVNLTHGKGDKASRDKWTSVASARHNRDMNKASEVALDLLERYLIHGSNITTQQKERWSGDYPLTVLEEAMKKIAVRLGAASAADLSKSYPKLKHVKELENLLLGIGNKTIQFKHVRSTTNDIGDKIGLPPIVATPTTASSGTTTPVTTAPGTSASGTAGVTPGATSGAGSSAGSGAGGSSAGTSTALSAAPPTAAFALNDPRAVIAALTSFAPLGSNREKVVSLKNEILELKLAKNPIAFCFLLRSMFEISVRAYFGDHGLDPFKPGPKKEHKFLIDSLLEAKTHLIKHGSKDVKVLHGASTELGNPVGLLSVTSMNQLVHNPTYTLTDKEIATAFAKIFPLLKALNS